jgi:hypothetical protein
MVVSLVQDHSIYLIKLVSQIVLLGFIPLLINVLDVTPLATLVTNQDLQDAHHVLDLSIFLIKPASLVAQSGIINLLINAWDVTPLV